MPKLVRTARGQVVDFDLIRIKQQLAKATAPAEVRERENFVERRLKRKLKQRALTAEAAVPEVVVEQPIAAEEVLSVDKPKTKDKPVEKHKD